jgi:predicted nuclease of predicted toxin-antitoxin system
MTTILADHDIEGQAILLWDTLVTAGWLELFPIGIVMFADVGLAINSTDREVWRFAQAHQMILLTNNRNMRENDSLAQTLRAENTLTSLPVLTIASLDRLDEREYRERCVSRLVEILLDLENYLGTARIFIP